MSNDPIHDAPGSRPPAPGPASDAAADPSLSNAGEEDPGAALDDAEVARSLRGEAALARPGDAAIAGADDAPGTATAMNPSGRAHRDPAAAVADIDNGPTREEPMNDTSDIIATLNELIETSKNGEYGFRACAEQARSPALKSMLANRAAECHTAAAQLQAHVTDLGGAPESDGSAVGAIHRGWIAMRTKLSNHDDLAVLEECERGEDSALESYREALMHEMPAPIRNLVAQQCEGVQRNHDLIRRTRDSLKAAGT